MKKRDFDCETPPIGGDEKIIIYQIKVEGWAGKSKQLLLITLPTILVNNNGRGLGKNKSFVNDVRSYKNS